MIRLSFIVLGITSSWNVVIYVIIGLLSTGIAKALFIEKDFFSLTITSFVGIAGAFVGAYFPFVVGIYDNLFMSPFHCTLSFTASISLLFFFDRIINFFFRKK